MSTSTVKNKAVALYDFQTGDKNHMPMTTGEEFIILNDSNPDWVLVKKEKKKGYVPRNYVDIKPMVIETTEVTTIPTSPSSSRSSNSPVSINVTTPTTKSISPTDPKLEIVKKPLRSKSGASPQTVIQKKRIKISSKKLTTETDIATNINSIETSKEEDDEVSQLTAQKSDSEITPETNVLKKQRNPTISTRLEQNGDGRDSPSNEYKRNASTLQREGSLLTARKTDARKSKAPNMLSFLPSNSKYVPNSNIKKMMSRSEASSIIQKFTRQRLTGAKFRDLYKKDKLFKDRRIRKQLIDEIYDTEKEYVNSLDIIMSIYYLPLKKKKYLEQEHIDQIFGSLPSIQGLQQNLLTQMDVQMKNYTPLIGKVFVDMALYLKIYPEYINGFDEASALLEELCESKKGLGSFLEKQSAAPECEGLPIQGFLIKPVQRIPRYKLLLRDLLKVTPTNHIDYENLKIAFEKIDFVAGFVNEQKRAAENQKIVLQLSSKLDQETQEIILKPNRRLIQRGNLKINGVILENEFDNGKPSKEEDVAQLTHFGKVIGDYQCYLFTDMLLLIKESTRKETVETLSIHFEFSTFDSKTEGKLLLTSIISGTRILFTIICEQNERESWVKSFNKAVEDSKERACKYGNLEAHQLEELEEDKFYAHTFLPGALKKKKHLEERHKHKMTQISALAQTLELNKEKLRKLSELIVEQTDELHTMKEDERAQKVSLEDLTNQVEDTKKKSIELDKIIFEILNQDVDKFKDVYAHDPVKLL
eukprot:gene9289-1377_t